jgi:L-seryl-tRNA(Ser) seleniumtransferase
MPQQGTNPRAIPSVDRLLQSCASALERHGRNLVVETIRALLDETRAGSHPILVGANGFEEASFLAMLQERLTALTTPSQRRVLNLTGTVLHTNLGRAVLPREAAEAVATAMASATNLEFNLARGSRGERDDHIEGWLTRLTGAEAATVVNNNAAAVLIALNTLAARKEVIVSRGELVEIGGAFRIPDIMGRAGCRLIEVGTTNRTHLRDYAEAIGPRTAALMKVHTSNYAVQGFTAAVAEEKLAELAHAKDLPFIVDLGSGMLVDLDPWGLPHEPTARETLAHGADLVTFSGDKLLGGPQAGMLVGRRDLVARINRNPLKRALRLDKMRIAALEAVLKLYADPDRLRERLPTLRWLTRPLESIEKVAREVLPVLTASLAGHAEATLVACRSQIGSGSLPVDLLPSVGIALYPVEGARRSGKSVERLASAFRDLPIPVIGRIHEGALILDLRTLDDAQVLLEQLAHLRFPAAVKGNTKLTRSAQRAAVSP